MYAIKKVMKILAFQLGSQSPLEQEWIQSGFLTDLGDGRWRVKTREATEEGELALAGDYVKIDAGGMPYPNAKEWFEANHEHLYENWYQQKVTPKKIWHQGEPMCPEMAFILERGLLACHPQDQDHAYSAVLWGTVQTAAADAVIIFDCIHADKNGTLINVEFHFVASDEFSRTYDILTP